MSTPTDIERISYGGPTGSLQLGAHRQVISAATARTLLAKESGALCLFSQAAATTYTLPTPVEGMEFEFLTTILATGSHKVVTATVASEFLLGAVTSGDLDAATDVFQANGTNIVALTQNGSTTGGLVGSSFRVTAISATQWAVKGSIVGTGTVLTPFATS
jgi:hypothetical protein